MEFLFQAIIRNEIGVDVPIQFPVQQYPQISQRYHLKRLRESDTLGFISVHDETIHCKPVLHNLLDHLMNQRRVCITASQELTVICVC